VRVDGVFIEEAMARTVEVERDPEVPVIEAIARGDTHAMAELMSRQERWVRGVVFAATGRRDDLDDIVQRVWMKVWRQARRLQDPTRWRVWLYRIACNAATDEARRRRHRRGLLARLFERERPEPSSSPGPEGNLVSGERHQVMLDAIESLPAIYREPFVLRHLEDWNYRQIADALDLPTATVETRLVRARRLLRERLAGKL
jgi:RNA polymerase sigma-70 factor (ECF subfamily)